MKIVVTGTSTGIGRSLAERLVARGHRVWGLARSQHSLGADAPTSAADAARWEDMARAARQVRSDWGTIDGLVTCAAVQGEVGRAVESDPAAWARTLEINLLGTFHAIRAFHPLLQPAKGHRAKIVCFSGGGATKARARFSAYGVAKTGVVRLVETIAAEEHGRTLDINAVAPGAINTRLTDEVIALGADVVGPGEFDAARRQKETGGGSLDRALALVEWLLSPASDRISGRLLSAPWDPWENLGSLRSRLEEPADDLYTLRRVTAQP